MRCGCEVARGGSGEVIMHLEAPWGDTYQRKKKRRNLTTANGARRKRRRKKEEGRRKKEEVDLTRSGPKARRILVPELFRKVRETPGRNFHQVSSKSELGRPSYDRKTKHFDFFVITRHHQDVYGRTFVDMNPTGLPHLSKQLRDQNNSQKP